MHQTFFNAAEFLSYISSCFHCHKNHVCYDHDKTVVSGLFLIHINTGVGV